ncbi:CRISPR-associated protein Cas4 [Hydrogenoanaerobacterium sp.]|uniref:CRISPR-associated protein Cas4 n=1 Tax=Hydrogenoanaerobacterium sp. TaxID=2953763 RepID=UPI00289BFE30|nr:CRISPR-associated protein Cas4 [Hydrogenoanaerobacterium sp.]
MVYDEEDFLMLSGIQHFAFCRRQWALIHIEQLWEENLRTVEGNLLHEKCHDGYSSESRKEVLLSRGIPIFSRSLGASGECDIVEFRKSIEGITLHGREGHYTVYPVEYKHGEPKDSDIDILQLTAQAICLEEMLSCEITDGAIFYGKIKRRQKVVLTNELKARVKSLFAEMHGYFQSGYIPKVKPTKSCNACSLKNLCLPKLCKMKPVSDYLEQNLGTEEV